MQMQKKKNALSLIVSQIGTTKDSVEVFQLLELEQTSDLESVLLDVYSKERSLGLRDLWTPKSMTALFTGPMTDTEPNLVSTNNGQKTKCGVWTPCNNCDPAFTEAQQNTAHSHSTVSYQLLKKGVERNRGWLMVTGVLDGKNNFQCYLDFFTFIFNWGDMNTSQHM